MRRSYNRRVRFRGGLRPRGFGLARGLEPILLHPPVKCSAAEPKGFSRVAHISLGTLQRLSDQNGFDGFEAEFFEILALRPQHVQSQVGSLNLITAAHQDSALESVFQFAHITRPAVLHEELQGRRLETLYRAPVT